MWNVGTVAQVCEIRACNNCPLLSFGREWYCDNSHVVTSCQSKVFFYRGNINSFLFLSKDCTPNILTENFPGRGAMPCIATLPERKVNLMIHSALKKKKKTTPLHPSPPFHIIFSHVFSPPTKTWHWVTSLRTHAVESLLWFDWKLNPENTESKFSVYNLLCMGLLSQGLVLRTQSFYFVLKRGWALAGVLCRRA